MKNILLLWLGAFSLAAGEEAKTKSAEERVVELEARVAKLEETVKRLSAAKAEPKPGSVKVGAADATVKKPNQKELERFRSLSSEGIEELRRRFTEARETLMNASPEERSAFMRRAFEEVQAEDEARRVKEAK